MRKQLMAAAAIVAVSLGLGPLPPQTAAAQQIVFDPRAVAQAVQQVRQGLSQIQQLQTQVTNQMAMLQKLGTGLFVIELMGHGLNPVTGDYSRGASGFWVEKGQIAFPVHEITIAGNMRDMFKQIVAVGNDLELRSNIRTGSVLIERMMVAGS